MERAVIKQRRDNVVCIVAAAFIAMLSISPALLHPHFGMLDFYPDHGSFIKNFSWSLVKSYMFPQSSVLARPLSFVGNYAVVFGPVAAAHFWLKSTLTWIVPMVLIYLLVSRVTQSKLMGLFATTASACQPTIGDVYYSIGKPDENVLFGSILLTYIIFTLVDTDKQSSQTTSWWSRLWIVALTMVGAVFTYDIKEMGAPYIGVCTVGMVFLAWGARLSFGETIRRTWVYLVINCSAFFLLFFSYLNLTGHYGGQEISYLKALANILPRMSYIAMVAPYTIIAFILLVATSLWCVFSRVISQTTRKYISCSIYLFVFHYGMLSVLIVADASHKMQRYYLSAITAGILASIVTVSMAFSCAKQMSFRPVKIGVKFLSILVVALLVMHSAYSVMVVHLSEGITRVNHDASYSHALQYIASKTATNGVAYFVMDDVCGIEPIINVSSSMKLIHRRPDIRCQFITNSAGLSERGYISVYQHSSENASYIRLPVYGTSQRIYTTEIDPWGLLSECFNSQTRTKILYAVGYPGPEYKSVYGIPAFWSLKKGVFSFGLSVYYYPGKSIVDLNPVRPNIITNGTFDDKLSSWQVWNTVPTITGQIETVDSDSDAAGSALRIRNIVPQPVGVFQSISVQSGAIYRLIASARGGSTYEGFDGSVSFCNEKQLSRLQWKGGSKWRSESVIITNIYTGTGYVYIIVGDSYSKSCGEFSSIIFEKRIGTRKILF